MLALMPAEPEMIENKEYSLKDHIPRIYQQTIFNTCVNNNCLVVLPTGLGKTTVALMLSLHRLKQYPNSKILIMAPTKPLVQQHMETFIKHTYIDKSKFSLFTGQVSPEKRAELWDNSKVVFSTPQGLENDIINRKIKLEEVSLLIVDEAQHATGDYSYVFVAKQYMKLAAYPRILALTASPGSDAEKINEVCGNLGIDAVEIRTDQDPDVKPYVQELDIGWINIDFPEEFRQIRGMLQRCYLEKISEVKKHVSLNSRYLTKKELLVMQARLHAELSRGSKDYSVMKAISLLAEIMKIQHALELIETQGIKALVQYMSKLFEESSTTKVKAVKNLVIDPLFKKAFEEVKKLDSAGREHPKLAKLVSLVEEEIRHDAGAKVIVFNQYRDMASAIVNELEAKGIRSKLFVGQAKKNNTGLNQRQQKDMLSEFSNSEFNVLVSTSVGEEGIDIPKVNSVIFYEPVPSAIRQIQRRGRTARTEKGKVMVLVTKGTRDEAYKWTAHHKENRMYRNLLDLKNKIVLNSCKQQENLKKYLYPELDLKIIVDDREKSKGIVKELIDIGIKVELKRLEVGDYLLSSRVAVEYKTVEDFVNSIVDGRLLLQLKSLKESYSNPVVIVEGTEDIFSVRKIHPNAILGMMATVAVSYGIPVLFTKDFRETSLLLAMIAKREQTEGNSSFSFHTSKPLTLKQQQEYIVSALPGIGGNLAKNLLERFGSVKDIFNADAEALREIDKIGEKKAGNIKDVIDKKYETTKRT